MKMGTNNRGGLLRKPNETMRLIITTVFGVVFGFLIGFSFPSSSLTKFNFPTGLLSSVDLSFIEDKDSGIATQALLNHAWTTRNMNKSRSMQNHNSTKIYIPTNPRGAETLPPGIIASESDYYLRRLWGKPSEDLTVKQKYLVTFTVGYDQKSNIDAAVKKFSENFTILLFHYDGRTSEWDEFEWSRRAIHVSARRQTKWWYAKRFLHPDIVAPYDYIFIWDEDLGVEHFNAEKYIELIRKHGLEISQPGLDPNRGLTWQMTKRRGNSEVHTETEERPGWCSDPHLPPCAAHGFIQVHLQFLAENIVPAMESLQIDHFLIDDHRSEKRKSREEMDLQAMIRFSGVRTILPDGVLSFVEIMAPVFSRDAWRCVWHMIQNDLVHGWGLDFALRKCVEPAHEKIGVVDSQWIVHQVVPSLGNQGQSDNGKAPWEGVRERCRKEWAIFQGRMENAEKAYFAEMGLPQPNISKAH